MIKNVLAVLSIATKVILASLFLVYILSSCKKKTLEQKIENLPPIQTTAKAAPFKDPITDMENNSFTLSCGSGCAVTYNAEDISQDKTSVKVKFRVDSYINDEPAETNYETYLFYYNNNGEIDQIINEETQKNILDEYVPNVQESFKEFAASLVKENKIEIHPSKKRDNPAKVK